MQTRVTFCAVLFFMATALANNALAGSSGSVPTIVSGDGNVAFGTAQENEIIGLTTKLVVPPEPAHSGTLFLWPGLQPDGAHHFPIDNGVLQPVLTWGPSCAPGKQPKDYSTWWISGQYVNTYGHYTGYEGCRGGPIMAVNPGDILLIQIALSGSMWTQTVLDLKSGKSVGFHISLQKQSQNYAWFSIESHSGPPISDVVFTETTIAFVSPDTLNCSLVKRGTDDTVTTPILIDGGQACYIEKITLKLSPRAIVSDPSCRMEGVIKSINGHHPTTIAFRNNRGSPILVYWIDYSGVRQLFARVDDGQSFSQATYFTNPWVVTDLSDNCISLFLPQQSPTEHVVY
jgi:hypothetical protein